MAIDVPELCDRMATKLYSGPTDRGGLIDISTVLLTICGELQRAADDIQRLEGEIRYTWLVKLATSACERRLRRLRESSVAPTDDELAWTADRILHILTTGTRILENASSRQHLWGT